MKGHARCCAVALLAGAAVSSPGARAAEACALRLVAEPADLVLRTGASAAIRVTGAVIPPRLEASEGTVGEARRDGQDAFVADYVPPLERYPRAVIVAASGAGCGWTVLRLHGTGEAIARGRPGAEVTVTVAGVDFGPVRTDATGEGRIPIIVPPGVHVARRTVTGEEIPLRVPPVQHVFLTVDRPEVAADRDEEVLVRAFAVHEEGSPREDGAVELEVSHGRVGPLAAVAAGVYEARWTLPAGQAGEVEVRALVRGEPLLSARKVARAAGAAHRIVLEADAGPIAAGTGRDVRIRVLDAAGNAPRGTPRVSASQGSLAAVEPERPGTYRTRLAVPGVLGDATATVLSVEAGGARAALEFRLVAAAADRVRVDPPQAPLVADGLRDAIVRVALEDRFGNPISSEAPVVASDRGEVGAPAAGPTGGWTYRYRPWRHEEAARDTIRATAGPLVGVATIDLARAPRRLAVAPRIGVVAGAGQVVPFAEMAATSWRGESRALELGAAASWFALSRSEDVGVGGTSLPFSARADFLSVLGIAGWRAPLGRHLVGWANAGAGAAWVVASARAGSQPEVRHAGFSPMGQLGLGVAIRALGGLPFAEARAAYHLDPGIDTFRGPLLTTSFCAGYRFDVR